MRIKATPVNKIPAIEITAGGIPNRTKLFTSGETSHRKPA